MAMRNKPMRFRAIRPATESLEGRSLLSGVVSGINTEGDAWTLKLIGPGSIHVSKQPDANGNPTALTSPTEIDTITIAGTDPLTTRLVGSVTPSGKGDGRVFFQNLVEVANARENGQGGNGLLSIDIPGFWLGLTAATAPTTSSGTEPGISIPDGTATLRFGGVDTTAFFGTDPTKNLASNGQSDQFQVDIGTPVYAGVRIIIDKSITSAAAATSSTGSTTQDGVTFSVVGRLGIFQANEIDGNTTLSPGSFPTAGGTIVQSNTSAASGVIGQIGTVRVGTNATNLFVGTNGLIHEMFIGGETNNLSVIAPAGTKNLYFGKGLDTSHILTHTISSLKANRGAIGSEVISERQIGNIQLGGDAVDSTFQSGYNQQLSAAYSNPSSIPTPTPQAGGSIRATVAGNVTNSVFAASYAPDATGTFGNSDGFALPLGKIQARVEGTIDNSTATPANPTVAFYAKQVHITGGAVVPPNVPEAPFKGPLTPRKLPGIRHPYFNFKNRV